MTVWLLGTFAIFWSHAIEPFRVDAAKHEVERSKALVYLQTTTCTDPVVRAQLEGANLCDAMQRIFAQSASTYAFHALMRNWSIFNANGALPFYSIDVSAIIWKLLVGLVLILLICCMASNFLFTGLRYAQQLRIMQLPSGSVSTRHKFDRFVGEEEEEEYNPVYLPLEGATIPRRRSRRKSNGHNVQLAIRDE